MKNVSSNRDVFFVGWFYEFDWRKFSPLTPEGGKCWFLGEFLSSGLEDENFKFQRNTDRYHCESQPTNLNS